MAHFTFKKRIEFSDTDMAGIAHFSSFFRLMEAAEHAFYRSLGYSVVSDDHEIGWPRVHVSCDFKQPARFEEEILIELTIEELREKSIRYTMDFLRDGNEDRKLRHLATGKLAVACVQRDPESGRMHAVSIPQEIRTKLETASK